MFLLVDLNVMVFICYLNDSPLLYACEYYCNKSMNEGYNLSIRIPQEESLILEYQRPMVSQIVLSR